MLQKKREKDLSGEYAVGREARNTVTVHPLRGLSLSESKGREAVSSWGVRNPVNQQSAQQFLKEEQFDLYINKSEKGNHLYFSFS